MAATKKAAAKKKPAEPVESDATADDTPDVSDVRISTKWDSVVDDDTGVRRYDFGDGSTGKAWHSEDGSWNVSIAGQDGRFLSSRTGTGLTVEEANILLERAGAKADAELAKRAALSD